MIAAPRTAAFAAALMIPPLVAPVAARAVEPTKGKDPLIRTWTYARGVSLDLTSFNGAPVVLVLGPGETVKHHASQFVSQSLAEAEKRGWFMPNNAVAPSPVRGGGGGAEGGAEDETLSAATGGGAGARAPAASLIADQIVLQPMRLDAPPVVLNLVTSDNGELRPYLLVLRVSKQDVFDPKTGQPVGYAQVIVQHPAKPDPVALAAARERREAARDRRDALYAQMRLAAAGGQVLAPAAATPPAAGPESFEMGDGRKSPGACQVLRPTDIADTGRQTMLTFDPRQPRMQVYGFTAVTGEPTRVQAVPENRPDGWFQYVLPGTYQRIALSSEGRVCVLHNKAYNRAPVPNTTGTSSPDVALVPR